MTRYEMALDTDRFARDFPLQWQEYQAGAVPQGAFPSYALGYYPRNNAFYKQWDAIARERDRIVEPFD